MHVALVAEEINVPGLDATDHEVNSRDQHMDVTTPKCIYMTLWTNVLFLVHSNMVDYSSV